MDLDVRSEIRPQVHSKKPPIGRVVILPNGVIDERNHDQYIIKEQLEEYDNFDKNSYFASSLDDHDKIYIDSMKEKMQSSLGEWYQPGQDENVSPKKKKQKKRQRIKPSETFMLDKKEAPQVSKIQLQLNVPGQESKTDSN